MTDAARNLAEQILRDIANGIPQPRARDWPSIEAVSAAGERAGENTHCSACREATA